MVKTTKKKSSNRADDAPRREVKMYNPDDVVIIGFDTDDGPKTKHFDQESNDTPLSEATVIFTMEFGILQAIGCERDGDRLIAVYGRGRTRTLREANKRLRKEGRDPWLLPVSIVRGDESRLLSMKIGENAHRREINPMARARLALELSEKMTPDQAAVRMNLSLNQFNNILKLNDLSSAAVKELIKGNVSETALATTGFSDLSEADQIKLLPEILGPADEPADETGATKQSKKKKKGPTVQAVRAKVQAAKGKTVTKSPAERAKIALDVIAAIDDNATKDELWSAIHKLRNLLADKAKRAKRA